MDNFPLYLSLSLDVDFQNNPFSHLFSEASQVFQATQHTVTHTLHPRNTHLRLRPVPDKTALPHRFPMHLTCIDQRLPYILYIFPASMQLTHLL